MSDNFCPFIGVEEDRYTAVGFPSLRNKCHRNDTPAPVDTVHQGKYCMTAEHTACPIFLRQMNAPVPPPAEALKAVPAAYPKTSHKAAAVPQRTAAIPVQPPKRRSRDILLPVMAVVGIVGIFLAVLLVLPPTSAFQAAPPVMMTDTMQPLLPSLTSTNNNLASMLRGSLTPTSRFSPTPPATATKKPTLTATKSTATSTLTVFVPTTSQCGRPAGWVQYIVRPGDTLSNLSRIFNISIAQLQIANCMGNSVSLYVGQVIYTPWIPPTQIIPTQIIPTQTTPTQVTPSPITPSATVPTDTVVPTTAVPEETPILTPVVTEEPTLEPTAEATIGAPLLTPTSEAPLPPSEEGG